MLSAPSNVKRNYNQSVNKEFNENLTISHMKTENRFEGVASGSPVKKDQRLSRLRREFGFINRNSQEFKTFSDFEKSAKIKPNPLTGSKLLDWVSTNLINQDQKINYMLLKETKHKKTDTLNQKDKPSPKVNMLHNTFRTSYNCNSESNMIWSDKPHPKGTDFTTPSTNVNSKINYWIDPTNTQRVVSGMKKLDDKNPKLFNKVNAISEFYQITHAYNPNQSKEYAA